MNIEKIKKRKEFINITKNGQKWVTKGMVVQVFDVKKDSKNEKTIRIGFTATKRVGNAVARNRIKRRLRAITRDVLPQISSYKSYDIVLIGRYTTADREYKTLRQDLVYALKKLQVPINFEATL